jgi:hypothetical protein
MVMDGMPVIGQDDRIFVYGMAGVLLMGQAERMIV